MTDRANTKTTLSITKWDGIAFDHAEINSHSLDRLRGKVNYTNITFNLVRKEITLPDLQQVYEVILGRNRNKVQFRRHIEQMVVDTGQENKTGAHTIKIVQVQCKLGVGLLRYFHYIFGSEKCAEHLKSGARHFVLLLTEQW